MKDTEKWELENKVYEQKFKEMKFIDKKIITSDYNVDELIVKWETLKEAYEDIKDTKENVLNLKNNNKRELGFVEKCAEIGYDSALGSLQIRLDTILNTIKIKLHLD